VGALAFAGDRDPSTLDAEVITPLTSDYAEVRRGLDAQFEKGWEGRTNMLAGISLATLELIGAPSARSKPRDRARKVALLFSDGRPTLPIAASMPENSKLAVEAARRAARSGIRIHTYGIGRDADAECLEGVARIAQGTYTRWSIPARCEPRSRRWT
jgi:Mg-chelatase subunit ChlD